jgi:hypothetical protein
MTETTYQGSPYNPDDVVFHYTTFDVFKRILKQTAILPDRSEPQNESERPTVTFSTHPHWEPTRYRIGRLPNGQVIMMNKALLKQFCGGLVRIVVPKSIAYLDWHAMKDEVGMSKAAMKGIYDFAISVGARTRHWWGTFESVPEDKWISVQKLEGEEWVELNEIPNLDDVNLDEPVGLVELNFNQKDRKLEVVPDPRLESTETVSAAE